MEIEMAFEAIEQEREALTARHMLEARARRAAGEGIADGIVRSLLLRLLPLRRRRAGAAPAAALPDGAIKPSSRIGA